MALGVVVALVASCERPLTAAERLLSIRLKSTFGISLPCSLGWCGSYMDGGTTGGLIVGREDSLKFAMGRLRRPGKIPKSIRYDSVRVRAWEDSFLRYPPTLAYVGVDHWSDPGGRPLLVGSPEESLLIRLLWYVAGADSVPQGRVDEEPDRSGQRFRASNVARALERQRSGLAPFRRWDELSPSERNR